MKKIFLTLAVAVATTFAGFADTSLQQAYKGLAALKGMSETYVKSAAIDNNSSLTDLRTSVVSVTGGDVQALRDQFTYMTENLPVRQMVVGANNMRELAAVYATPAGNGKYNVLILTGNTLTGNFVTSYGQTDAAGVKALRNADVYMDADQLTMSVGPQSQPETFISMSE